MTLAELRNLSAAVGSEGNIPTQGPLPVSVPGAVKGRAGSPTASCACSHPIAGWCDLHKRFGKLDFASVLAPAIRYAREGFPVSEVSPKSPRKTHQPDAVLLHQVIAWDWMLPSNDTFMTSNGRFPNAIDGILSTFTIDGKK